MEKLNIGIVGLGWAAGGHLTAFNNNPHCNVAALCTRKSLAKEEISRLRKGEATARRYSHIALATSTAFLTSSAPPPGPTRGPGAVAYLVSALLPGCRRGEVAQVVICEANDHRVRGRSLTLDMQAELCERLPRRLPYVACSGSDAFSRQGFGKPVCRPAIDPQRIQPVAVLRSLRNPRSAYALQVGDRLRQVGASTLRLSTTPRTFFT